MVRPMSKMLLRCLTGALLPFLSCVGAQAAESDDMLAVRARTAVLAGTGIVPERVTASGGSVSIVLPASAAGQGDAVRQTVSRIIGTGSVSVAVSAPPAPAPVYQAPAPAYVAPAPAPAYVAPAYAPPAPVAAPARYVAPAPVAEPAPAYRPAAVPPQTLAQTASYGEPSYGSFGYDGAGNYTSAAQTVAPKRAVRKSNGPLGIIDEVRIGAQVHDYFPTFPGKERNNIDLNGEILFDRLNIAPFTWIWNPRPHLGGTLNFTGLTSFTYAGFTWEVPIYKDFFFDLGLGGAWHSGWLGADAPTYRKRLGSDILFREGIDLGYRLNGVHSLSFYADHLSNAHLAHYNQGLSQVGLRYGYKFNGPTQYE